MRYAIALVALLAAACGHVDLPTIGSALTAAKDGYIADDDVRVKADAAVTLVCAEPPPAAVSLCSEAQHALGLADAAAVEARRALNVAIDIYTAANEAAK